MPVLINAWTQQKPMVALGATGVQSIKVIPACRVFIKTADITTAAPVNTYAAYSFKTLGLTPTGWTDLGITNGMGKVTYTKNVAKVTTGMDKVVRKTYVSEKSAVCEFDLSQLDDYVMTQLGFNSSVITAGSTVNFQLGQEDVVERALLLVYANKLDGKEIHWYHPAAQMVVNPLETNGELALHVSADLIAFTALGAAVDSLVSCTIFA